MNMRNILLSVAITAVLVFSSCGNDSNEIVALRLDKTEVELVKGSEIQLKAVTVPAADVSEFEWYSTAPEYVSVTADGVVKAEKLYYKNESDTETSPVSVFCKYQAGAAECKVTVLPLDAESLEIKVLDYASDALIMSPGEEKTLQVVFYPADADVDTNEIQWATTAFEYAVVAADPEDGAKAKVTALEPGSASIKAVYGKHTAIIHLIVRPN